MESLLLQLADVADAISLPVWERGDMEIMFKPDGTRVTAADVAIEQELRTLLAKTFPGDGFCGEEVGATAGSPDSVGMQRTWIIDGIDGTHAFTTASPAWSTHIALTSGDATLGGIVTCPALGKRWYTPEPDQAYVKIEDQSATALAVSGHASIAHGMIARWPLHHDVKASLARYDERIASLTEVGQARMMEASTSVSTGAILVAQGQLDAFVMFGGQPWDHAAPAAVVRAAGGRFSCLAGSDSMSTGAGVYSNGQIHDALIAKLQGH